MKPADSAVRKVGAFTAACVLVSNAVGSGIFTTSGFMARDLGDPSLILLLWGLGGVLALAGAMSYSELGASLPRVGGEYVYLRRAFGPLVGFLSGWTSFSIGFSAAIAATAVAFGAYLAVLLPGWRLAQSPTAAAVALVWLLTAIHSAGVERGGSFQRFITIAKIAGIGLLISGGLCFGSGDWGNLQARAPGVEPGIASTAVALIFVLYSFSGWNAAGYIAGEIRDPGRNLPLAMVGGTLFIAALYLAVNAVYFYALPASQLAAEPVLPVAEKAASALLGPTAATAVVAVLCVSIAGSISSMIWAGPRVYWAMARDRAAPAILGRTSRANAPVHATVLQSVWITLLVLSGSFEQLVIYSGVALALFSALAVSAVIVLRRREPELARPYRVKPYPWVPLAYIAASLWIAGYAAAERPLESLLSLATVAVGVPFYLVWSRREAARGPGRQLGGGR